MYILLCFLLLVTGFYPMWFGHYGFLESKKLACGDRATCTTMVHCERTTDWFEDGARAVQTRGARRGERGEPRINTVCKPNAPP